MKARIKESGEIVDIEDLYDDGTALIADGGYIKVSKLEFLENNDDIDWKKVRADIAMSMIRNTDWQGFCGINFTDMIFNKANELTKKLMSSIE